jgi:membrane protease YdiL (CAAX protease family)
MGILAGWIYLETQSLWPCIIFHALGNLLVELIRIGTFPWKISGYSAPHLHGWEFQPLWFDTLGVALTALGLMGLSAVFRCRPNSGTGQAA